MKKKSIKAQIKTLYINLRREVIKREKYFDKKSESWQNKNVQYNTTTEYLNGLLSNIEYECTHNLDINLPYLK